MAVFQISRIQVRRGQANVGTGIPQLASGEMAWAVDSQELYIGSGSVSEGAPSVSNVRVLTLNDIALSNNILSIGQYVWKYTDTSFSTGISQGLPTNRAIQAKLDDIVSSADFGLVGDGTTDNTVALQNAIDQLFLNTSHQASLQSATGAQSRYVLKINPGIYKITSTIHIPSYATIEGVGADKVIFNYVPTTGDTSPAFNFVNDTSSPGTYYTTTNLQYTNQARYIYLKGFTIQIYNGTNTGMQLDSVRESLFENIKITGSTTTLTVYNSTNLGIVLTAFSSLVTCTNNKFKNIHLTHLTTAIYSKQDILSNNFSELYVWDVRQGISFGKGSLGGGTTGEQYGPRENTVSHSRFYSVRQHAVYIERGEFNSVVSCKFENVGNDGGNNLSPVYPQVFFKSLGNNVTDIQTDRTDSLINPSNSVSKYIPEVTGNVTYTAGVSYQLPVGQTTVGSMLLRLPATTDSFGVPSGAISYSIHYVYRDVTNTAGTGSSIVPFTRSGVFQITADVSRSIIHYADDYTYAGADAGNAISQVLTFSAVFLDQNGTVYTGSVGQTATSIAIYYVNTLPNDSGVLSYSYSAVSYYPY